jgi:hypothetical protein
MRSLAAACPGGGKAGQKKTLKEGYFFTKNSIRPKITMGMSARKI